MGHPIGIRDPVGVPQIQAPPHEGSADQEAHSSALIVAAALLEGSLLLCGLVWLIHITAGPPSRLLVAVVVALAVVASTGVVLAVTRRGERTRSD